MQAFCCGHIAASDICCSLCRFITVDSVSLAISTKPIDILSADLSAIAAGQTDRLYGHSGIRSEKEELSDCVSKADTMINYRNIFDPHCYNSQSK